MFSSGELLDPMLSLFGVARLVQAQSGFEIGRIIVLAIFTQFGQAHRVPCRDAARGR